MVRHHPWVIGTILIQFVCKVLDVIDSLLQDHRLAVQGVMAAWYGASEVVKALVDILTALLLGGDMCLTSSCGAAYFS